MQRDIVTDVLLYFSQHEVVGGVAIALVWATIVFVVLKALDNFR